MPTSEDLKQEAMQHLSQAFDINDEWRLLLFKNAIDCIIEAAVMEATQHMLTLGMPYHDVKIDKDNPDFFVCSPKEKV